MITKVLIVNYHGYPAIKSIIQILQHYMPAVTVELRMYGSFVD